MKISHEKTLDLTCAKSRWNFCLSIYLVTCFSILISLFFYDLVPMTRDFCNLHDLVPMIHKIMSFHLLLLIFFFCKMIEREINHQEYATLDNSFLRDLSQQKFHSDVARDWRWPVSSLGMQYTCLVGTIVGHNYLFVKPSFIQDWLVWTHTLLDYCT